MGALARSVSSLNGSFDTVYFGGGTPSLCPLERVLEAAGGILAEGAEFTVELNPADVTANLLKKLAHYGVNRLSLGFESLDDATLASMGRRHNSRVALDAFMMCRDSGFANVGVDLIAGYPTPQGARSGAWKAGLETLCELKPDHASVYTLILEEGTPLWRNVQKGAVIVPDDDAALGEMSLARDMLASIGLERYEISNFARPTMECRHNLAVWRGEDYIGLGEGAMGRQGLDRTSSGRFSERLSPEADALERAIFSLRTRDGLDLGRIGRLWPILAPRFGEWRRALDSAKERGLLVSPSLDVWRLTRRGAELCDSILVDLA